MWPPGGAGALDGQRGADPGEPGPGLPAAPDPLRADPHLPHPADLPLHLGEQEDGHHRQGAANHSAARPRPITSLLAHDHSSEITVGQLNVN